MNRARPIPEVSRRVLYGPPGLLLGLTFAFLFLGALTVLLPIHGL